MQEEDLKNLGQLFEKAGDGTDEEKWTEKFQGFVKKAMTEHATRLKSSGSEAEKKAEGFRAKFALFSIVEERLSARCEAQDPGIVQAMKALQEAQGKVFQEVTTVVAETPDTTKKRSSIVGSTPTTPKGAISFGDSPNLNLQVDMNSSDEGLSSPDAQEQNTITPQANTPMSPNQTADVFRQIKKCNSYAKRHQKTKPLMGFSDGQEGLTKCNTKLSACKDLQLPQLMNVIASVYQSKAEIDSKADPDNVQPMELHFYSFLAQRYGLHAVKEWAEAIFKAIRKFCNKEVRVAAFGKILQNRLAEDFPRTLETLSKKLQDSAKEKMEERNVHRTQAEVETLWQAALQGRDRYGLQLSDCSAIVFMLYNDDDSEEVMRRLQQECKKNARDSTNHMPPDCIRLRDLCQVVCIFQMNLTENFLADFITMFDAMNEESDAKGSQAGILECGQLTELVRRLSHMQGLPHAQLAPLLDAREKATAHALRVKRATFSQCVTLFSALISARWAATESGPEA